MDYEQLYYNLVYENRKLKQEIDDLKTEISLLTTNRNNKTLDLIIKQINEYLKSKGKNET